MKDQIINLTNKMNVQSAKAWWATLTPQQKATAVTILVGIGFGAGYGIVAAKAGATFWQAVAGAMFTGALASHCTSNICHSSMMAHMNKQNS